MQQRSVSQASAKHDGVTQAGSRHFPLWDDRSPTTYSPPQASYLSPAGKSGPLGRTCALQPMNRGTTIYWQVNGPITGPHLFGVSGKSSPKVLGHVKVNSCPKGDGGFSI